MILKLLTVLLCFVQDTGHLYDDVFNMDDLSDLDTSSKLEIEARDNQGDWFESLRINVVNGEPQGFVTRTLQVYAIRPAMIYEFPKTWVAFRDLALSGDHMIDDVFTAWMQNWLNGSNTGFGVIKIDPQPLQDLFTQFGFDVDVSYLACEIPTHYSHMDSPEFENLPVDQIQRLHWFFYNFVFIWFVYTHAVSIVRLFRDVT